MSGMLLSFVFLNYNRLAETKVTVRRLRALVAGRSDMEIIAVDNGSSDGTRQYLARQPDLIQVFLDRNSGIAGYNAGFLRARGRYLFVLDDDSHPRDWTCLDQSFRILDRQPKIGIVACHIENPDGTPQWSWHLPRQIRPGPSPFFIGCGFVIRRDLFASIGWYPKHFFLYQNEVEVALQARLAGYGVWYHPRCRVVHRTSPASRSGHRRVYYPTRNSIWLIRKYYPQPSRTYMTVSRLVIGLIRAVAFKQLPAYVRGARDGLCTPVQRNVLDAHLRREATAFWRQNSLFHQLLRKT